MTTRAPIALLPLLLLGACTQEIVVIQCDGHALPPVVDGGTSPLQDARADAGPSVDTGVITDTQMARPDAGHDPCIGLRYCLRAATPSTDWATVREPVTIHPDVQQVGAVTLTYRVDAAEITATRPADRPAAVMAEIDLDLAVDPQTGEATLRVISVPPWFFETTLHVPLHVRGGGAGDPELTAVAEVVVGGNTLISIGLEGVFAIDSGGHPATMGGTYPLGRIITDLVGSTRGLLLLADGTLLVYDSGPTPHRLRNFRLTGPDVLVKDYQHTTPMGDPVIVGDPTTVHMMVQLGSGKVIMSEHHTAGVTVDPHSWLLAWNADGTFDRRVVAGGATEVWRGVGVAPDGDLLVADREAREVTRHDPITLLPRGGLPFIDSLPGGVYGVLAASDGAVYVSGERFVVGIDRDGVRASVAGLPAAAQFWRALSTFGKGRVLAASNEQSDDGNIAIIDGQRYIGPLRPSDVAGKTGSIRGIAHLQ